MVESGSTYELDADGNIMLVLPKGLRFKMVCPVDKAKTCNIKCDKCVAQPDGTMVLGCGNGDSITIHVSQ